MRPHASHDLSPSVTDPVRVGAVSYLNTLPLIDGLDRTRELEIRYSVPSLLISQLVAEDIDIGLCSSIDYQRSPRPLAVVPVGMLGSDGPTLTVRLYSTGPVSEICKVYCDTDSHTSVALLRIVLKETYDLEPELIDYNAREHVAGNRPIDWPETMLLIGDKVVSDSPPAVRYPHQLDLGGAWKELTGLPFVFAVWMTLANCDPLRVTIAAAALDRQRRHNLERLEGIVHRHASARGWPVDLARDYLQDKLLFDFTERGQQSLELFFAKAFEQGLTDVNRPLETMQPTLPCHA